MEFRASALKKGVEVNGLSNGVNGDSKDVLTKDIRPAEKKAITIGISDLKIEGFISPSTAVANFLNIPYARIPARFRQAVLVDPRKEKGVHDATRYGPCCPQPVDWVHFRTSHLYETMIEPEHSAEFACLSLNIYAPAASVSSGQRLPVLAWVHGGGFTYGDGGSEYGTSHCITLASLLLTTAIRWKLHCPAFPSDWKARHCGHYELPPWLLWVSVVEGAPARG